MKTRNQRQENGCLFKQVQSGPITLLPVSASKPEDVRALAHDLRAAGLVVTIETDREAPAEAYDARRGQYEAEAFLGLARREVAGRVLAVTDVDLYSGRLNFVFGIAEAPGRAAVVSFHRLRLGADATLFRERALKEAVHELGHTFGLEHCPDSTCVMCFSNRLADTDRKGEIFCAACRRKVARAFR